MKNKLKNLKCGVPKKLKSNMCGKQEKFNMVLDNFFSYTEQFKKDFEDLFNKSEFVSIDKNPQKINFNDVLQFANTYSIFFQLVLGIDYDTSILEKCYTDAEKNTDTLRIFGLANCIYERINNIVYES